MTGITTALIIFQSLILINILLMKEELSLIFSQTRSLLDALKEHETRLSGIHYHLAFRQPIQDKQTSEKKNKPTFEEKKEKAVKAVNERIDDVIAEIEKPKDTEAEGIDNIIDRLTR
ncbi:MAG: hypothetical protein HC875_19170 [Anaerolineales bacterium]|nr:hypothetical protein [Anaerolineales bacterium]